MKKVLEPRGQDPVNFLSASLALQILFIAKSSVPLFFPEKNVKILKASHTLYSKVAHRV